MTIAQIIFTIFAGLVGILVGGVINMLADDLPYTHQIRRASYLDGSPRRGSLWLGLVAFFSGKRSSPRRVIYQRRPYLQHYKHTRGANSAKRMIMNSVTTRRPETLVAGGRGTRRPTLLHNRRLSWRYPLTELTTAIMFAYVAARYGFTGLAFFWMGIVVILILITVIDLEHRLILFVVMIPSYVYALIGVALVRTQIVPVLPFFDYLIGGAIGFLIFLVMYGGGFLFTAISSRLRGEPIEEVAFGYGDVMLATLSGLLLGWQAFIFALFIAVFAGGVGAMVFLIAQKLVNGKYEMFTALPYGQYIVFGTLIMMFWREPVISYVQIWK
jgi:prepilin signal peptidase PulO-like enzyme (type II secretory pathway)